MSSEKSAKEIAVEILSTHGANYSKLGKDYDGVNGFVGLIEKAIEQERANKAVVWPSDEEIAKASNVTGSGYDPTWFDAFDWLKSKVKPVEIPVVSYEDVLKLAIKEYSHFENEKFNYELAIQSFYDGFKAAMALVRERMGE